MSQDIDREQTETERLMKIIDKHKTALLQIESQEKKALETLQLLHEELASLEQESHALIQNMESIQGDLNE